MMLYTAEMMLYISFPGPGYQELIEVNGECELCTFYEEYMATEAADASLCSSEKAMWFISVVGMTNRVFP